MQRSEREVHDAVEPNLRLVASGLWRWLKGTGLERFELLQAAGQWTLRGTILTLAAEANAVEARYEIACDDGWFTKSATISIRDGSGERKLEINVENGAWYENGKPNHMVKGCVDIDLGWTPSTNTLPIRRLHLDIGKSSGTITAAWVRFPELKFEPLPQEYVRLSDRQYRYSSRGGAFVAELSVDEHGLVVEYEGFWQRVKKDSCQ